MGVFMQGIGDSGCPHAGGKGIVGVLMQGIGDSGCPHAGGDRG